MLAAPRSVIDDDLAKMHPGAIQLLPQWETATGKQSVHYHEQRHF
jgi:hypothetical protein